MRIAEARFATRRLDEQKAFYGGALGLPPLEDDGRIAAFGVGDSRLVFAEGEGRRAHVPLRVRRTPQ